MRIINFYAVITIIKFRLKDFVFDYNYSIIAPLINTLIFVIIFSAIDNHYNLTMNDMSFLKFLVPGLILMTVVQTSFDYTSTALIHMKQIGSFDDFLIAPISRLEIFFSFIISSIIIGLFISIINYLILSNYIGLYFLDLKFFLYYLIIAIILFSSLGCVIGFMAYKWDTQSTISNFIISPINLLSGTFFSINVIPESLKFFFIYNPYYYVVLNFRSTFNLNFEYDILTNLLIIFFTSVCLFISAYIFYSGFKVIK